jgi:drug/metabolite transporter (DMT)-like permease
VIAAGVAVAVAAAACYELGYVVQARAARADGDRRLRPGLLARLARDRGWLAGTAGSLAGAGLQILALTLAPVSVVQPTLALGLVLLLVLAHRVLGERPGRRELLGVGAVLAGVAGCALAAPPQAQGGLDGAGVAALLGALALVLLAPFVLRARLSGPRARVAAAAAGDVAAVLSLVLAARALDRGDALAAAGFAAGAAAAGLLALTAEMSALARMAATHVAPVILAAQVAVPVVAAPLLLGERWGATPLGGAVLGAAVALVTAGAVVLASSPPVAGAHEAEDRVRR